MRKRKVDKNLEGKIRNYLEYQNESREMIKHNEETRDVIDKLPALL